LHLAPVPWMLRLHQLPAPIQTHEDYWAAASQQRADLQSRLRSLPPELCEVAGPSEINNYEAQQAPLYYVLFAPFLWAIRGFPLLTKVFVLRIVGLLLASLWIPFGYLSAQRIFRDRAPCIAVCALAISMPELIINLARISNETLAVVFYSLLTYQLLRVT